MKSVYFRVNIVFASERDLGQLDTPSWNKTTNVLEQADDIDICPVASKHGQNFLFEWMTCIFIVYAYI